MGAFAVLAILLGATLMVVSSGPVVADSRLLEKDDWVVTGLETITGEKVVLTGNLTIEANGILSLVDTELEINLSSEAEYDIRVDTGGSLELSNTTIRSATPGLGYDIQVGGRITSIESEVLDHRQFLMVGAHALFNRSEIIAGSGSRFLATETDLTLVGTSVIVDNATWAMELMNSTVLMVSTIVKNIGQMDIKGLNVTAGTILNMEDGGIYNFSTGIKILSSDIELARVAIMDTSGFAIAQYGGNSQVTNSRLMRNAWGLMCVDGDTRMMDNEVQSTRMGFDLERCPGHIEGNTIRNSDVGIETNGARVDIIGNTIRENTYGISWGYSDVGTLEDNMFINNEKGASIYYSSIELVDSHFESTELDIEAKGGSGITLKNTSYRTTDIGSEAEITVYWYLTIDTRSSSGGPAAFAQGTIDDSQGDSVAFMTDSNGMVGPILLMEKSMTRYHTITYSPYDVIASLGEEKGRAAVDLTASGTIIITLKETDLYIIDLRASKQNVSVGEWAQVIINIGTTYFPVYDVEIHLLVQGQMSTNSNIDVLQDMTEVSFPFMATSAGDYKIAVVIDPDLIIEESNETNNKADMIIPVGKGSSNGGGNDTGKPDLHLIGLSQSDTDPFAGSIVTLSVEIQNSGDADAEDILVRLYIDNVLIGSKTIGKIGAGSVGKANFDWEAEEGNHTIRVEIDPFDMIEESNELNNNYTTDIEVGGTGIDDPFGNLDSLMFTCLGIIIVFIIIIVVLLVLMTRKPKPAGPHGQQQYGAAPYSGPQYQTKVQVVTPTTIEPRRTRTSRRTAPATTVHGQVVCKRCGRTNIKFFDDGHKLCRDCRKIFF